jgi:ATP-dependent Clp protease ATP-binding subunit ClpC
MFERFTSPSRRVVVLAQEEARELNHGWIGTEHLLMGLLAEGQGAAARVLASADVTLEAVRREVEALIGRGERPASGHIPFTPRAKKCLELSLREALQRGDNYIGTGHLLLGLMDERDGVAAKVLEKLGDDLGQLRERVMLELENQPEEQDLPGEPVQLRLRPRDEGPGVVAHLQAEIVRLRAMLREHDIDPGQPGDPHSAAG